MSEAQRYLVTGGAGFIGSHLCERLLRKGHQVTLIDDLSTGSFSNIEHLVDEFGRPSARRFRFAIDSIANQGVLDRLASQANTIIHLAAAVGVRLIVRNPVRTIETNVLGTEAVLKAAARYRCKVLLASTSEVYGKGLRVPFREEDDIVLGPTSRRRWAYAASKMVDEFLTLAYHAEQQLPVVIFRLFNTVGPRQTGRYGMVLPRFVAQAQRGEELTVFGDGSQSRCFMHVQDAICAILSLDATPQALGQVFNIGSNEEITIRDLAGRILQLSEPGCEPESRIRLIPYEEAYESGFEDMARRVPSTEKIKRLTAWQQRKSLDDILKEALGL